MKNYFNLPLPFQTSVKCYIKENHLRKNAQTNNEKNIQIKEIENSFVYTCVICSLEIGESV